MDLRTQALNILCLRDPAEKAAAARALHAAADRLALDETQHLERPAGVPGRPDRPALVPTLQVPKRSPFTTEGRAALIHAIAHIEFNAINLALDAIWRFAGMPRQYYF